MKKLLLPLMLLIPIWVYGQAAVGTVRKSMTTDVNGNVLNSPVAYSNQFHIYVTSSNVAEVVVFQQLTNSIFIVTNEVKQINFGGTGSSTTQLTGSWTNTINFRVNGTNSANAYSVHGQLGFSGNVTNMVGTGLSNIVFYSDGIVTNRTTIP